MSVISPVEAQEWLNLTGYEFRLQGVIDAAEAALSQLVGPLEPTEVTETLTPNAAGVLILSRAPVVSLDGATLSGVAQDTDAWTVAQTTGIVSTATYGCTPYVVTYTAGWTTLPKDLRFAVLELVRHLWSSTQRGSGAGFVADRTEAVAGRPGGGPAWLLPNVVESLIAPYVLPSVA